MPILEKYKDYFEIDPEYFPAVNESVIKANPELWKKFFPHKTFVDLLKTTVSVLDRKQKLSIWVEGEYGTGKSHAVLTLKKILDASDEETKEYFERYSLDKDLCNNFLRIKHSGKILTVHRYNASTIHDDQDLVLAIQESIEQALEDAGIKNQGRGSLKEAIIRYLSDPENKESFGVFVKGSYKELFGGDSVDAIIHKLSEYQDDMALHTLMEKIFKVAKERQIRAFTLSTKDLTEWIKEVIVANNLKAIVFIWDEFTEYFQNNARNFTGFQELVELSEYAPFYFVLATHLALSIFNEKDPERRKIEGRFVSPRIAIKLPENIAFQLMGAAMEKNSDPQVAEDWLDILDDLENRTKESRKLVKQVAGIDDRDMKAILPIHPFAALMLKHISASFDSNQRSMFDFIKNDRGDEIKGFQWFIHNYGPECENPLLTIDMLWEFFYEKGKDFLAHDVRSVLDYYSRSANQKLSEDEKRVLKTVLLLQAISTRAGDAVELFIPNDKNIDRAFEGTDMDGGRSVQCAEKLVRDKILFKKSLGNDKFQYNAYASSVPTAEVDKLKDEIDRKSTTAFITEELIDKTTVGDVIALSGALHLRYDLKVASSSDFDQIIKQIRNQEEKYRNKIAAVACFAKDDAESATVGKKIRLALEDGSFDIVFIDASLTPFGKDGYSQYREELAQSMYQRNKDTSLANQYARNAKEILKKWKGRLADGEFIVYTKEKPDGERATSLDVLYDILMQINKRKFKDCLEGSYNVIANMFAATNLKLGVECGVNRKTSGTYMSASPATKLENALAEAWNDERYWESHPNILISRIKIKLDELIQEAFAKEENNRISIRTIYEAFVGAPFGFMPCNLTAFILGFVLKEYTDGSYTWSDGLTNDVLDSNKLKEMVEEIIKDQNTPNPRYKDKYIVAMTDEEKAFNDVTARVFGIPPHMCTSVEQTRDRIRGKMKELSFPIWTVKYVLNKKQTATEKSILEKLIDNYSGIANSGNATGGKTENNLAMAIGKLCRDNPDAAKDLKELFSKENCTEGMKAYLLEFEEGLLPKIADQIGDNGQFINALRKKFDADAANWVWNVDTANQKIHEVILEYQIIAASNRVVDKTVAFDDTIAEWINKCQYIRISYAAAKNYLDDLGPFLEILHSIKKKGQIMDSQKATFLSLIETHGEAFVAFKNNQLDLFSRVCAFYLDGLSGENIKEFYQTIPAGTFTYEKSEYLSLVENRVNEFRNSLGQEQLKKLWKEKTGTDTPKQWSKAHRMPVLALVSDEQMREARDAFDAINRAHPDASAINKAMAFFENTDIFEKLSNDKLLDEAFADGIIKHYTVMLTDIGEVKDYLASHISADAYDWLGLPEVEKKLKQMAEAKYARGGCDRALEKIDEMDVADVKRYLKELIKDNMVVGMEIIREK